MGDVRYQGPYGRIRDATNRISELLRMPDEDVIAALAAVARQEDTYLANVLATEAINRHQRARAIIQSTGEGIVAIDLGGDVLFLNPAAEHLLGITTADAAARACMEVLPLASPPSPRHPHPLLAALHEERQCALDALDLVRGDGRQITVACIATPVMVYGQLRGAVMVFRDVTENLRIQQALLESEARLRTVINAAPVILFVISMEGRITFARGKGITDIGSLPERIVGLSVFEMKDAGMQIAPAASRCLAGEEVDTVVDAGGFTFHTRWTPMRGTTGNIVGGIGVATDVTHLTRAQRETERAVALLEATLEGTADGILVVDRDGKVVRHNKRLQEMWELEGPIPPGTDQIAAMEPAREALKDPAGFRARVEYLVANPELPSEDVIEFKDGRVFERSARPQAIGNRVVGRVWSFRDVTETRRAKSLLEESEMRYHSFVENNLDGIATVDMRGKIIDANPAYCELLGYARDELIGRNIVDLIDPTDRARQLDAVFRSFKGPPETLETRLVHKDGHLVDVRGTSRPILVGGRIVGAFGVARDITQRKRGEEELHRTRERLSHILEATCEGICLQDQDGTIVFVNAAAKEIAGHSGEGFLGRPFDEVAWNLTAADGTPIAAEELPSHRVRRTGQPVQDELYGFTRADGAKRFISLSAVPIDRHGDPRGTLVISFHDVTDAYRAGSRIRENEQRYRSLFEFNPSGVGTSDPDGLLHSANPALLRLLGRDIGDIVGRRYDDFVAAEDVATTRHLFAAALRGGTRSAEITLVDASGQRIRVHATGVPILVDDRIVGVHGVITPVGPSGRG